MKKAVKVAVTGVSGSISSHLIPAIIRGDFLGSDQPIELQLLCRAGNANPAEGLVMELEHCATAAIRNALKNNVTINITDDPKEAFDMADYVFLAGACPRIPGMERSDLIEKNAPIFEAQGKALNNCANPDIKILVIGNPANTNALIVQKNAPNLDPDCITAMMSLDHQRAQAQIAQKLNVPPELVEGVVVWGNHSHTQYADLHHATVNGKPVLDQVGQDWFENEFIPNNQQFGKIIMDMKGSSSAMSAADAAINQMRQMALGTDGKIVTLGLLSEGDYGFSEDVYCGLPAIISSDGQIQMVADLEINDFSLKLMQETNEDLLGERKLVSGKLPSELFVSGQGRELSM